MTELIEPLSERAIVSIVEEGEALLVQFYSNCSMYVLLPSSSANWSSSSINKLRKSWKSLEDSTDLLLYKIAYQYKAIPKSFAFLIFELTYLEKKILQLEHEAFPIYSKVDEGFLSRWSTNNHLDILETITYIGR